MSNAVRTPKTEPTFRWVKLGSVCVDTGLLRVMNAGKTMMIISPTGLDLGNYPVFAEMMTDEQGETVVSVTILTNPDFSCLSSPEERGKREAEWLAMMNEPEVRGAA